VYVLRFFFFFSSRRRHTRLVSDWSSDVCSSDLVAPFMVSGIGMAMFWAPVANVVLTAVRKEEEGQASGAQNAIRELGGVFGVAVLASIFAHYGGYVSPQGFVDGMRPAVWVGAAIDGLGALAAIASPRKPRAGAEAEAEAEAE